jgi:hypothetical protein
MNTKVGDVVVKHAPKGASPTAVKYVCGRVCANKGISPEKTFAETSKSEAPVIADVIRQIREAFS